jgi:hypothetical protein
MSEHARRRLIRVAIGCGLLAVLLAVRGPGFESRWRALKDGMTQKEVTQALGSPTSTGRTGVIGAGDQPVTRWEYKRGGWRYCVDFDYIGPGGAPAVFRTERYYQGWEWDWPSWFPWARARARA